MVRFRWGALIGLCVVIVLNARTAQAQKQEPPGPFAVDLRLGYVSLAPTDPIAKPFALTKTQMPARALAPEVGAHYYPLRRKRITLGIGANYLTYAHGSRSPDPAVAPADPTVRERFTTWGSQLSFNFGTSQGWSYFSGGIGSSRRSIQTFPVTVAIVNGKKTYTPSDAPFTAEGAGSKTINYGGGARWFTTSHIAFAFDLRWYAINPTGSTSTMPALPRQTLFVANAGISIH